MKPRFSPGKNIALKSPVHEYASVIRFYNEILSLEQLDNHSADPFESVCFAFGDKLLWVDKIAGISQSEVWLEIIASDLEAAQDYLRQEGCHIRNEIESLPATVQGFWLSSPSNIIHLVTDK